MYNNKYTHGDDSCNGGGLVYNVKIIIMLENDLYAQDTGQNDSDFYCTVGTYT